MTLFWRGCGVFLLLLPLFLIACVERTELEIRHVRRINGKDAGHQSDSDHDRDASEPDASDEHKPDEEQALRPQDYHFREEEPSDEPLEIDEKAPTLKILSLERREGADGHYLAMDCDDPTEERDYNFRGGRWQYGSQTCQVKLANAFRAIQIEPALDLRIAPTPYGLRILGDFEQGSYQVRLKAGLKTESGAVLKEDFHQNIEIPALSPSLELAAQGRYLPRGAWGDLQFRHRNLDEVTVAIHHIPRQNMAFWLADGRASADQRTSNKILEITLPLINNEDHKMLSSLHLDEHLGQPEPGLYQIQLLSDEAQTSSLLQVSDINLLAKKQETKKDRPWTPGFDVWALDMQTTRPLTNVQIEAIRPSGKIMARCTTSRDGHCRLDLPDDDIDKTPPMAIVAKKGADLTYLKFDELRTELTDADISGPSFLEETAYHAAIYGDRDLYRPGDEFHLIAALRDDDYRAATDQIPLSITIKDPQNKIVLEEHTRTDELGLAELSFRLNERAPTGRWRAELEVGAKRLKTYAFHVEEFVPERMEAFAKAQSPRHIATEDANFEVSARYLFGASAAGSEVEARCRLIPLGARVEKGFHFGPLDLTKERRPQDLPIVHGLIGDDDKTHITCPTTQNDLQGPATLEATFAILEAGSGRTTNTWASTELYPSSTQIGLKSDQKDLASGDTFTVEGALFDLDGDLITSDDQEVTLEFYNLRHQYSHQYDPNLGYYTRVAELQILLERVVDVQPRQGRFAFETTAAAVSGGYLVRARQDDAISELQLGQSSRQWLWQGQNDRTPRPLRPTSVLIKAPNQAPLDRPTEITFIAPFAGPALMTVETDRVIHQEWIHASEGQNRWEFIAKEFTPNVYISAFILGDPKHRQDGGFAPERAFGATSVAIEKEHLQIPTKLHLPQEIRPNETLEVKLATKNLSGPAKATIAAVDEGILQLTRYASPDPLSALLTKRGLGVETFDTIGWATQLPPSGPSSATGGDADYEQDDSAGRIMPFKPVALWSGPVELDENGETTVEFEVPNYRGRLRVMAVVFTKEHIGKTEQDVLVRDPLTVQATFPRFMTVGDEVQIPVFLTNLTDIDRKTTVTIDAQEFDLPGFDVAPDESTQPILDFLGPTKQEIELAAGQSKTLYFTAQSIRPAGAAKMRVRAQSDDLISTEDWTIPLRPGGPKERITQVITLDQSEEIDLGPLLTGWLPTSEETTLWVSAAPQPDAFDHLEYLIRYPYGCTEQTVSSARPLLFISELIEAVDPSAVAQKGGIKAMIEFGIDRVLTRQHASGAFSYWPGEQQVSTWVSAYALHFLMDAADQGYAVPQARIDSAISWLKNQRTIDRGDAYIHYVLALAGEGQRSQIEHAIKRLPQNPQGQQAEDAYLLYAALYLSGDRSFEHELKNPMLNLSDSGRTSDYGFYSHSRQRAIRLNIFADLFGPQKEGLPLAMAVTDQLTQHDRRRYYTTQEVMWSVTGLGKWYRHDGSKEAKISLLAKGKAIRPGRQVQDQPAWSITRASELKDLSLKVERPHDSAPLYAVLTSEGVRQNPTIRTGGDGLEVERTYLTSSGEEVGHEEIPLGELIYVRLRLQNRAGESLNHVALADYLPAGLEIENTDLGAAPLPHWATDNWDTDHRNARDDRMEFFGTLRSSQTVEVVYAARATLAGKFHAPTVEVEAMYQPHFWARAPQQDLHISAPWKELVD